MREWWYIFTSRVLLRAYLYMTQKDQIFVVNVMTIDSTSKTIVLSVITQLVGAIVKLSVIVKIHKYKGLYEGHHFIPMAMEVHDTPRCDIDRFIKECACLFHDR